VVGDDAAALGSVLLDYLQEREAGGEALRPLEEAASASPVE
jgi:hypothetical protein